MSDVNVIITAVDKGMDIMDGYEREVEDLRAHVAFDIHSVIAAVEHEKSFVEQKIDDTSYSSYEDSDNDSSEDINCLYRKKERYEGLQYQSSTRGSELEAEWVGLCKQTIDLVEDSKRVMADYIRKLNRINYSGGLTCLLYHI